MSLDDEEAVNKLNEKEIDSFENVDDDNYDLPWSVEQETGKFDQRSSDDESQVAIDMKMTDICEEKCLAGRCGLGAMPQGIPDWEYETRVQTNMKYEPAVK